MDNMILLARPNYFLVNDMQNFISENGFTPKPLKNLNDLNALSMNQVKGVVISTAVSSNVDVSYMDVVNRVRSHKPGVPIVFATMVDYEMMKKSVMLNLEKSFSSPVVANINNYDQAASSTKAENMFLMLHKDEISNSELRKVAGRQIGKHFGQTVSI